jgi:hypothetical protein
VEPDALQACSACAGDYEDPDRTAWSAGSDDSWDEDNDSEIVHGAEEIISVGRNGRTD